MGACLYSYKQYTCTWIVVLVIVVVVVVIVVVVAGGLRGNEILREWTPAWCRELPQKADWGLERPVSQESQEMHVQVCRPNKSHTWPEERAEEKSYEHWLVEGDHWRGVELAWFCSGESRMLCPAHVTLVMGNAWDCDLAGGSMAPSLRVGQGAHQGLLLPRFGRDPSIVAAATTTWYK